MTTNPAINEPIKGTPLRASWAAEVARSINGMRPMDTAGAQAENPRLNGYLDTGCWTIRAGERTNDGETESVRLFANQFYLDGEGILEELELDDAVEDFVAQGDLSDGEDYSEGDKPFVALKVPASTAGGYASLVGYATLAELQAAQQDPAWIVRPLYKFAHDGWIVCDFRTVPAMQLAEVLA